MMRHLASSFHSERDRHALTGSVLKRGVETVHLCCAILLSEPALAFVCCCDAEHDKVQDSKRNGRYKCCPHHRNPGMHHQNTLTCNEQLGLTGGGWVCKSTNQKCDRNVLPLTIAWRGPAVRRLVKSKVHMF